MNNIQILIPPPEVPLFTPGAKTPSWEWFRFWAALRTRTLQTVQATVNDNVAAAGTTQATATALESEWNVVTSTPANSGVVLDGFDIGVSTTVFNRGGATLKIYPPFGMQIDSRGTNNPYSLSNGKAQIFSQDSDTHFFSTQPA